MASAALENLKATELRLGLPGAEDDSPAPVTTTPRGSKRAIADHHKEEEFQEACKTAVTAAAPAAKAQVVGWPPVRSYRKSCFQQQQPKSKPAASAAAPAPEKKKEACEALFVKVSMDGAPYLRKVDLKMYKGYRELREALEAMFLSCFSSGDAAAVNPADFAVTYEDKDGDLMLVGDVPFQMFMSTCKRLRIMKGSEARGLGSSSKE